MYTTLCVVVHKAVYADVSRVLADAATEDVYGVVYRAVNWTVRGAVHEVASGPVHDVVLQCVKEAEPVRVETIDLLRSMGGIS